jgi:ATPase subunit of ABC transporter with duplicated ATPase domains
VVVVSHDRWFVRGAVEGILDDDEEDEDGEDDDVGAGAERGPRRRTTYRLKTGTLCRLERGVSEFEELMEKRANKLLQDV